MGKFTDNHRTELDNCLTLLAQFIEAFVWNGTVHLSRTQSNPRLLNGCPPSECR